MLTAILRPREEAETHNPFPHIRQAILKLREEVIQPGKLEA
jgi:hypothetical protein